RGDPQLPLVPFHAVTAAAVPVDAERNLTVADLVRAHVDLEDAVRVSVRAHPHAAVAVGHARRIARMRVHRLQRLAVPVDEPCRLVWIWIQRKAIRFRTL